jgi:hypothetical protein
VRGHVKVRDAARASSRSAPRAYPEGLALWTFLWGAGCRRLRISTGAVPAASDVVVSSVAELLRAAEDERTSATVLAGLDVQLRDGFLERWLSDAVGQPEAARSARAIREDTRGLKVERWLQGAGLATYFVGGHRIDSVHDLATLLERGGDPTALWEHVREGVPQERFKRDPEVVRVLEAVRTSRELSDRARPLIACIGLGLRRLPWADRFLESLDDLERAILEPGGRSALYGLMDSGVLQAWVEAIAPGKGALVAAARGLDPAIAVDRAVRRLIGPAMYPVPGVKAADHSELCSYLPGMFHVLCGDPEVRARIRDALFGPVKLPGAPPDPGGPSEAELCRLGTPHDANMFAWCTMQVPLLHVGPHVVRSAQEYLTAIADPRGRAAAARLSSIGVVSMWYRVALGKQLSPALSDSVPEHDFPALCLEMGEPPPAIAVKVPLAALNIPEGGVAEFSLELENRDALRTAILELTAVTRPPRGAATIAPRMVLPPQTAQAVQLTYPSPPGASGQTTVTVAIAHAGPRPVPIETRDLKVTAGFPWQAVATPALSWIALVTAALFVVRLALQPLTDALLYRGNQFELRPPPESKLALLGLAIAVAGFGIEHVVLAARHRRFWPTPPRSALGPWAIAATVIAVFVGVGRGFGGELLVGVIAMGIFAVKLSKRDPAGAAIFTVWLFLGKELGWLLVLALGGLDTIAILAAGVFSGATDPGYLAVLGWALCGSVLGLAWGLAIGLRAASRPFEAESVRLVVVIVAALLILLLGMR